MLTPEQKQFISRAVPHMANGLSLEDALREVMKQDALAYEKFRALRSYERDAFVDLMAHRIFINVHTNELKRKWS